jgi:hypothetical protein
MVIRTKAYRHGDEMKEFMKWASLNVLAQLTLIAVAAVSMWYSAVLAVVVMENCNVYIGFPLLTIMPLAVMYLFYRVTK